MRSLRPKGIRRVEDIGNWVTTINPSGYVFRPRPQTFNGNWTQAARAGWNQAVILLSGFHITWLYDGTDELLLQRQRRQTDAEDRLRKLANLARLAPSPTSKGGQIWGTDGSMVPAAAGLLSPKSVTASITGPTTLVLKIEGRNIASTQGELIALMTGILFSDTSDAVPRIYTDYLNVVNMIQDNRSSVNQDSKLRRMNARSYYRWIISLATAKNVDVIYTRGHSDEISIPSQMNHEADYYASSAQRCIKIVPKAPLPTFFMDDFTFYSERDGWIESNIRHLVDMLLVQSTADVLSIGNHQRMLTSIYEPRPPPDFPYTRAYSAYSATVQLYARSGQLAVANTLKDRNKLDADACRFGCNAIEDAHHLFVDCERYMGWRMKAAEVLRAKTNLKLSEQGVEETARKRLLTAAKSLFSMEQSIWPLKHSFYYLGHIPPLDPLLPMHAIKNHLKRERLLHHLAADWHLTAIRLAGRIFGDYQREMAKQNAPLKKRGKS